MGRVGVEPTTPAMSRRYPNQARPPAQYTMKKFVAQIYVVDRPYVELTVRLTPQSRCFSLC
jgi:hypothetical protein